MSKLKKNIIALSLLALSATVQAQTWIDVTDTYIVNPNFDNNDITTGWQGTGYGAYNPFENAEHYERDFDSYQEIHGLTPGSYRVSIDAFYRMGSSDEDYNLFTSGNYASSQHAKLYATSSTGDYEVSIVPISSGKTSESLGGGTSTVGGSGGWWGNPGEYVPNNMEAAHYWFEAGKYPNSLEVKVGDDGVLRIGIRKFTTLSQDWTCLDTWKLEYYGTLVKATKVTLDKTTLSLCISETYQLTPTFTPTDVTYKKLTWSSSKTSVATVSADGVVTAIGEGTATITATTTDGSNKKATCTVTVTSPKATSENIVINEICAANIDVYRDPSTNFGPWVEIYNPTDQSVALGGLYVTDDASNLKKNRLIDSYGALPAHGYALLNFDHFEVFTKNSYRQINDKLNVEGGTIIISDGTTIIAQQDYPQALSRTSYARTTDGGDTWGITGFPTPGETNNGCQFATEQLAAPVVDTDSKVFSSGSFKVNVTVPAGATLRYTSDGTTPTLTNGSNTATNTFLINQTSCYRFRLFQDGKLPSPVVTRSYIKSDNEPFPVISVVTDRKDIDGDNDFGLFNQGQYGRPGNGQSSSCNWNMDWDRPVNFEYFTTDGECIVAQECDFSMCGGWSRAWTPHSFKLKASKQYDFKNAFEASLFPEKPYVKEKTLQIRNGGNDTSCRIKDAALQQIAARSGLYVDYQAWQPVHVYINGKSHAVLNMREPNNKHNAYANYGIDTDEMDQFEIGPDSGYVQMEGTKESFLRWYELAKTADSDASYAQICELVDIDEYINYLAVEFYLGGTDWPQNNLKGFRDKNGKFHFVLFDLDGTFATNSPISSFEGRQTYNFNSLHGYDYSQNKSIQGTSLRKEIEFVTIFINMLKNATFKKKFIDAYCIVAGSVYDPDRSKEIVTEMANYLSTGGYVNPWSTANNIISNLSTTRQQNLTNHLQSYLGLKNSSKITADISTSNETGKILLNGMEIPTGKLKGTIFSPATLTAVAPAGYRFAGWTGSGAGKVTTTEVFAADTQWKYNDTDNLDGKAWKNSTYSDSSWKTGKAPLGYGKDNLQTTLAEKHSCYYFRKTISITSVADSYTLDWTADDGFVIYVNGQEAGRYLMNSGTPTYNTYASSYAPGNPDTGSMTLAASLFKKGSNVISIEVHNNNATSSDIYWEASLSANTFETEGEFISTDAEYTLPSSGTVSLHAVFTEISDKELIVRGVTPVRINEVSAGNDIFVNDHFKKNDWVELYNTTDEDINLAGMYISDNTKSPKKYQIPAGDNATIPAHGYRLIWCDDLQSVGQLHAPFKLDNADGASVSLQAADGTWADRLEYLSQPRWHTYGRYPDGANSTSLFSCPTIAQSNRLANASDNEVIYEDTQLAITLSLKKGWNWTSHNLSEQVDKSRFETLAQCIRSQTSELYLDTKLGWVGSVSTLNPAQGYKVQMTKDGDVTLRGELFDTETPVNLAKGWNWIGFPLYNATTIPVALNNYKATEGDVLVGQTAFATYEGGTWSGTLTSLTPGQSYLLKTSEAQSLRWNSLTSGSAPRRYQSAAPAANPTVLHTVSPNEHANVMNLIATLSDASQSLPTGNYYIAAFADDGECRGISESVNGLLYLTIHGDTNEPLSLRLYDETSTEFEVNQMLSFRSQTLVGTRTNPYLLSLSEVTEIAHTPSTSAKPLLTLYFTADGKQVALPTSTGTLPTIFIQKTTYSDGSTITSKVVK